MIYIAEKKISVMGGLLPGKSFSTCGLQPPWQTSLQNL